ncbi:lytic polysaccharide monooxygenase [Cohnella sp. GCM10027633]|uniref:lytic polysaccharide monooxygenase n=1 Tax=unclassified Cohnella TaxID=2636738 RepID=UPI00362FEC32
MVVTQALKRGKMTLSSSTLKLAIAIGFMALGLACMLAFAGQASAHGYIESPASRTLLCQQGLNKDCGQIQYEPQSVEGKGNFPAEGPADGQIAGGGHYSELDAQTSNRWKKVDMKGGLSSFKWKFSANHVTKEWKYYITKSGWDPNKPLTRDQLESKPFCTIDGGNKQPAMTVTHQCMVPTDRTGYHIILGVWEIGDTANAFYQAIDVNLTQGDGPTNPTVLPNVPANLLCSAHTENSITMSWSASTASAGIKQYEVSRNGKLVGTTAQTQYTDGGLPADTAYSYTVVAVDNAGNRSASSAPVSASTLPAVKPEQDVEAPSRPSGIASSNVTKSAVTLSWAAATDNVGVTKYEVYRNGKLIGTTASRTYSDSGLTAATVYSYTVSALDAAGNRSAASAVLAVTTQSETVPPTPGTGAAWDASKIYLAGDKVVYNGIAYTAGWWTKGDQPDSSDVWKASASSAVQTWSVSKAYSGGDKVVYAGRTYQAKWWTKGETPSTSGVWMLIS